MKHIELPTFLFGVLGDADSPAQVVERGESVTRTVRRLEGRRRLWLALRVSSSPEAPFQQLLVCPTERAAGGKAPSDGCLVCVTAHPADDAREAEHADQDGIVCEVGAMGVNGPTVFPGRQDSLQTMQNVERAFWDALHRAERAAHAVLT